MTGSPYVSGKTSPARSGQPAPESTSTAVYQLTLSSFLPWLEVETDRTLNKTNKLTSNTSTGSSKSGNNGSKPEASVGAFSSSVSLNTYDRPHTLAANSSSTHSSGGITSNTNSCSRSRVYNIRLPTVYSGRSVRVYGSFSSGSTEGGSGVWAGSSTFITSGTASSAGAPIPLPPQGSLTLSSLASQTTTQGSHELALLVRGRGLSRTFTEDSHPIDSIKDIDILTKSYKETLQTALDSQLDTPCSSGATSPTITVTQSPLSMSRGGWTSERSSLYSTYSMEDFDKLATDAVSQHFEEIKSILFEGVRDNLTQHADVVRECHAWSSHFPHLRVLGKQACTPRDTGFCHIPSSQGSRPASSGGLLDVSDNVSLCSDSQGLCVTGQHVSAIAAPVASLSGSDWNSSPYAFLAEEVIDEDGVYEDVIAVDYKDIYEDNMEYKKQITPRQRRIGYPPITPNACVKDSVMSGVFDHVWREIMSWLRELLNKYTSEISDLRKDVPPFSSPNIHLSTVISREVSLILPNNRQNSFQRSNTHMGSSSTEKSINELLHITSMPLKNRPHGNHIETPESHFLGGSSTQSGSSISLSRPPSIHRHSLRGSRGVRLAPISKTSSFDEDKPGNQAATVLRVKGHNPISSDLLHSPPSSFQRNVSLPPLDVVRTQYRKLHQGHRAASAIDNKDVRLLSYREKAYFVSDLARPNTTNAMRESEPQYHGNQSHRSSTALGNTYSPSSRNSVLVNRSLDIRGNSLQLGGDTIHIHPDIQEDLQESTGEDVYQTHWNTPQPNHSMYRRSQVPMR